MKFDQQESIVEKTLVEETPESSAASNSVDPTLLHQYKEKFQDLTRGDVQGECILGCGFAGAISIVLQYVCLYWGTIEILVLIVAWPFLMVLGFIIGLISSTIVSLIIITINASLDWVLNSISQSFVIGGLSGFIPAALLLLMTGPRFGDLTLLGLLATSMSVMIGHLGAYWFTKKVITEQFRRAGSVVSSHYKAATADLKSARFGIAQIMIFTAWTAVGFMLISMMPDVLRDFLATLYIVTQTAGGLTAVLIIWFVGAISRYRRKTPAAHPDATVT